GALDDYGHRAAVLASLDQAVGAAQKRQKAAARGQMDLFGMMAGDALSDSATVLEAVEEADSKQILEWEKEFLGLYLSSHPLTSILGAGVPHGYQSVVDLGSRTPGDKVKLIGMLTSLRRVTTRTNKSMGILEVED